MTRVLVVATSRKTRGGITSVVKAHETGEQWTRYHCRWIETHRDGNSVRKLWYLITALFEYLVLLPFYDIVHIHVGLRTSVTRKLFFARLAKLFNKTIIVHFHPATEKHLFDKEFSTPIRALFSFADEILVLSPQWIIWIEQAFPADRFTMQVVYNPCPLVNRGNAAKKKTILYAGILSDRKGYNRLIDAFSRICDKCPGWSLTFAGNGEISKAKAMCEKLGISDKVHFWGWVSGDDKSHAFQTASIYCLPSWGEGFPMGVLDAMAYGLPVVTTPVGGIEQVLTNGVNCLIYDTYDIDMLSEKLLLLMNNENMRNEIVTEADKLVNDIFNIENICKELDNVYRDLSR